MRTNLSARIVLCLFTAFAAHAAPPVIQGVVNAANYQPTIASATWVTITGTNLATSTASWSVFTNGNLPTSLSGVTVTINNQPAYIAFVSPAQINVLAPDDPAKGNVPVQVTNSLGTSNSFSANKQAISPALFAYSQLGGRYAVVQAAATYELVAPYGTFGRTMLTVPAAPGENLILYGTGLGPVSPAQPTGMLVPNPVPLATTPYVTIGGVQAVVQFAGLVGSGLYQINVVVPAIPSGDAALVVAVNGTASAGTALVPVQAPPGPVGGQTAPPLVGCLTGPVDYITYSVNRMNFGQPDETSIGGTMLCSTCKVKPPIYPEFADRMAQSINSRKNIQACYDANGVVFQVKIVQP